MAVGILLNPKQVLHLNGPIRQRLLARRRWTKAAAVVHSQVFMSQRVAKTVWLHRAQDSLHFSAQRRHFSLTKGKKSDPKGVWEGRRKETKPFQKEQRFSQAISEIPPPSCTCTYTLCVFAGMFPKAVCSRVVNMKTRSFFYPTVLVSVLQQHKHITFQYVTTVITYCAVVSITLR